MQTSEALNERRQYHVLPILPCRQESQQITDVLAFRTLQKVAVLTSKGTRVPPKVILVIAEKLIGEMVNSPTRV